MIKKNLVILTICFFTLVLNTGFAKEIHHQAELVDSRINVQENKTRIVLVANQAINYEIFRLHRPNRLVVDLKNTVLDTHIAKTNQNMGVINNIRTAEKPGNTLRIVFDLNNAVDSNAFQLPPSPHPHARIVIDLENTKGSSFQHNKSTENDSISTLS